MKVPAVTNLYEVYRKTQPGRFQGSHNGSQPVTTGHKLPTGPKRQHLPPATAGHKCPRGRRPSASRQPRGVANAHGAAAPARSARLSAPRMPTGPQPQNLLPVTTGHKRPQVLSPGAFRPSQGVTNCPRGLGPSAFRLSQLVTNAHGAPPPARAARHNGSQIITAPQPRRFPPATQSDTRPRGAAPKRSARHNGSQTPAGPHTQRVPLVRTDHQNPRGLSPSAFRPLQRVTNAHGAHAPAHSARHNGSQIHTGP